MARRWGRSIYRWPSWVIDRRTCWSCWVSGGSPGAGGVQLWEGIDAGAVVELVVEGDGGVDQRQVGEGLGEVAQLLAGLADLLGVQAQVVGVGEHLLEDQPGLLEASRAGQGVHV